jgi:hypothetical protein
MSTGDPFPPGKRSRQINARIRPTVADAVQAVADEYGITLAAAIDHLLATHPDVKPTTRKR